MSLEGTRDVAIIIVALLVIVQLVALIAVTIFLYRKASPLLDSAREAVKNVQGTTAFLAETTVHPVIRVVSFLSAVRTATGTVAKFVRRKAG